MFLLNTYSRIRYSSSHLRDRHNHDLARDSSVLGSDADWKKSRPSQLFRLDMLAVDEYLEGSVSSERQHIGSGQESPADVAGIRLLRERAYANSQPVMVEWSLNESKRPPC